MPAVVTARNTPGTHNNTATGPFSETGMRCGCLMQMEDTRDNNYVTFTILVQVLAPLSLP